MNGENTKKCQVISFYFDQDITMKSSYSPEVLVKVENERTLIDNLREESGSEHLRLAHNLMILIRMCPNAVAVT